MHHRLPLFVILAAWQILPGCASAPRPIQWWRNRLVHTQVAQPADSELDNSNVEALSSAPPKLPPGIELPPESPRPSETQPSGATQSEENQSAGAVIFAGYGKR